MGEWTKRKANEHKCDYPRFAVPSDTAVGDIWTCKCGKEWIVTQLKMTPGFPNSPDQREHADTWTADFSLYRVAGGGIFYGD